LDGAFLLTYRVGGGRVFIYQAKLTKEKAMSELKRDSAYKLLELINSTDKLDNEKMAYRSALFELYSKDLIFDRYAKSVRPSRKRKPITT